MDNNYMLPKKPWHNTIIGIIIVFTVALTTSCLSGVMYVLPYSQRTSVCVYVPGLKCMSSTEQGKELSQHTSSDLHNYDTPYVWSCPLVVVRHKMGTCHLL